MVMQDQMNQSILNSVKQNLGYEEDYHDYDQNIMNCINTVLIDLSERCGIGTSGFVITGDYDLWSDFISEPKYASAITYVWMKVKMMFDPDDVVGSVLTSYQTICDRIEFQLMTSAETYM